MNRKELIEIADMNSRQFKTMLHDAMEKFMEENDFDIDDVAYALGLHANVLETEPTNAIPIANAAAGIIILFIFISSYFNS